MEENQETQNCCICGEDIFKDDRQHALCDNCQDTWMREVDCHW